MPSGYYISFALPCCCQLTSRSLHLTPRLQHRIYYASITTPLVFLWDFNIHTIPWPLSSWIPALIHPPQPPTGYNYTSFTISDSNSYFSFLVHSSSILTTRAVQPHGLFHIFTFPQPLMYSLHFLPGLDSLAFSYGSLTVLFPWENPNQLLCLCSSCWSAYKQTNKKPIL